MKIKTSELTGAALEWAVAKCEGYVEQYVYGEPVLRDGELHIHYCKASEIKKGMRVVFDMGYGYPMEEACTVIEVEEALSLFSDPIIRIVVRRYNGDVIQIAPHFPNDKVSLEKLL